MTEYQRFNSLFEMHAWSASLGYTCTVRTGFNSLFEMHLEEKRCAMTRELVEALGFNSLFEMLDKNKDEVHRVLDERFNSLFEMQDTSAQRGDYKR